MLFWSIKKILKKCGFGVFGGFGGVIFIVIFEKRLAQQLRRIILLHFGLVSFRIHFGKTENLSFSWFSDLVDMSMTANTNIIYLWTHQDTQNNSRTNSEPFKTYHLLKYQNVWSLFALFVRKRRGPEKKRRSIY